MKKLILIILLSFFFFSCKEEPTKPQTETNLTLEVLDKSCTEVWIDIKANDQANKLGSVYLNDEFRTQLYLKDTLVYLDELMPNKTYIIKLTNQEGIGTQTEFTTMDTTSHNFTWETFEFGGEGGSSYLRDVAIINENDIWAVGEIFIEDTYTYDSNGVWQHPYNAVHWDGSKWELKRIFFYIDPDQPNAGKISSECISVFKFENGDYIITSNVQAAVFRNGSDQYKLIHESFSWEERFGLNAIWGKSTNDFYAIGKKGNIAHYNGNSWSKIETELNGITDNNISHIFGVENILTKEYEYYLSVPPTNTVYYMTSNYSLQKLELNNKFFRGIWSKNGLSVYIAGYGIVKGINKEWIEQSELNNKFYIEIIGTGENNIVAAGLNGNVAVYNGKRWKNFKIGDGTNINFFGAAITENIAISVGAKYGNSDTGFICIGRRN
ncbi:MAG: hypothetical protein K8F60_14620 [Melioribacteraceae bacterium]|nr:hypothetical protein [Melioribacteraceae bacterium]